jgi:NAD(P)-dependent dehydrogenase (short-subunit alcohol dehydrogenase family)
MTEDAETARPDSRIAGTPLAGQHALVTGATRGIGAAIAERLAGLGAAVTLLGRNATLLAEREKALRAGGATRVFTTAADVTDGDALDAAFAAATATLGAPTILVNNAGAAESAPFLRSDLALLQRMIDVNLVGTFLCTQRALPAMVEAGFGRIVNIASTSGVKGYAYVSAYCAAKHAVVGLTRALALEMARKGVTVNAVCPGYTETDIVAETVANIVAKTGRSADEARATLVAGNPQRRMVQPGEVAEAVAFLCLASAGAITGQSIAIAGGEVM